MSYISVDTRERVESRWGLFKGTYFRVLNTLVNGTWERRLSFTPKREARRQLSIVLELVPVYETVEAMELALDAKAPKEKMRVIGMI